MTPEELIGRSLLDGEYVLQDVLGRGGMATVYRAYCRSLDTDVAVKVLAPRLAGDPGFRERFHDEARSLAPLHHPNLIEVHRYGEEGGLVFIAMRLVEGGTLKQLAQAMRAPLDIVTTARLISQVADALQLAHEENLIHLDIKPANILLGRHDWPLWPLLADFGITRAAKHQPTERGGERLAGTPLYMSPEQCVGGPIDGRSDEYSLAITTFELLTGQMPFVAETTELLLQRHIVDPPPRVREMNPGVPGPVEEVVLRGLAKSPDDRYPTVREFGQALTAAAERARGVSLETKSALSAMAPNLIAAIALVLIGPLLLTLLPEGALVGSRLPLVWPFQFALGLMLTALLWGIRWHLTGLLTRGAHAVLDTALAGAGFGSSPGPLVVKAWRNAIVAAVEGTVNLGYLIVFYRLLAVPALTILATLAPGSIYQAGALAVGLAFVVLAVGIVAAIYRSSGPAVGVFLLAGGWALAATLPATDLGLIGGAAVVEPIRLVIGAVLLAALLALRRSTRPAVARAITAVLDPLLRVARPGATPEQAEAGRRYLGRLAEGIVDYGYLLLGYALLQAPLLATLRQPLGVVPAAILVSGVAALLWVILVLRLRWIAGTAGAALGVVLGAPLLTTLPLFQPQTLGVAWPATVASWVVAAAVVLLLAVVRGQVQTVGQRALGPLLDRGLAGTRAAPTEAHAERRARALGALAGALVDVLLLVIGYWVVGLPAVTALSEASGRHDLGSIVLAGVVLAALGLLAGPTRRALLAVEETGGSPLARRFAAAPGLAIALAALFVGGCAAVPAVLAAPNAAGDLALVPPRAPVVLVDWQHYVPWTPAQDQAAYAVSLSCSDGRALGVFQEAFRPAAGAPMPSGNVGKLGLTEAPCSDWASTYFALRQGAGLPAQSSVSWDAVDLRAALQPDGSADVVETHRVLFTNGAYASLNWPEAAGEDQGQPTGVAVAEAGVTYANGPAETNASSFRVDAGNGQTQIDWSFPAVASPAVRTYTIHYQLAGVVRNVAGGQQFARQVLLPNRAGPVWRMTVEVTLPGRPPGAPELSSTGVATRNGMIDGQTAWFAAENVPPGNGLGIVVKIPSGAGPTPPAAPPSPTGTSSPTPTGVPTTAAVAMATVIATVVPPSPSPSASATPIATETGTPAATPVATATQPTATRAPLLTATPTRPATATPTITVTTTASATATGTATATPTITPTASPTLSPTPSLTRTVTMSPTPTATPTVAVTNTATPMPSLVVAPASGPAVSGVRAGGANFGAGLPIGFTIDGGSFGYRGAPCGTGSNGSFACGFTFPAKPAGSHVVTASDGTRSASARYNVIPKITISPTSGGYTTPISVTGVGFAASSPVNVTFGGAAAQSCKTDGNGSFGCSFPAPCYSSAGTYAVVARDGSGGTASASFNYTSVCIP